MEIISAAASLTEEEISRATQGPYRRVLLACGHDTGSGTKKPPSSKRCPSCSKSTNFDDRVKQAVVAVGVKGRWISRDLVRDLREARGASIVATERDARRRSTQRNNQRQLASLRASALDDDIVRMSRTRTSIEMAQFLWDRAYHPGTPHYVNVMRRIDAEHAGRAASIAQHLDKAENGETPDSGLYPQYGARAIRNDG